jgi:2-oxoacid:acceptor oxidoreductase gamma subunit (pyruvate/2-ketoisovalerate family)
MAERSLLAACISLKEAGMGKVHEITVWTSGVVKDKEGRDVANALARAGQKEGKFVQAFDNYVDLPDRVNVPVRKYARISDEEIEMRYEYENHHPEVVVLVTDAIVKGMDVLRGMPKGGVLVVNTPRKPEQILKFVPNKELLKALVCVDADGIAGKSTVDFSGSEGGIDATALGAGVAAPLLGAVARATGLVKLESLEGVVANKSALKSGYEQAVVHNVN